jgi:carbonic anhydrase
MSSLRRCLARPLPARAVTGVALLLLLAACSSGEATPSASADSAELTSRVDKLEREVKSFSAKAQTHEVGATTEVEAEHEGEAEKEKAHEKGHFTYEGEAGPEKWAELDTAWETCATGEAQSPTNLTGGRGVDLTDAVFDYKPSAVTAVNNGHTVQVDIADGGAMVLDGKTYALKQFHFHRPSEHTIEGKAAEMELHLVHADADGKLAVVGVMLDLGAANTGLEPVWAHLPAEKDAAAPLGAAFDAATLLPAKHAAYRYQGSLTTPPCSEGVEWSVLEETATLSQEQSQAFATIFAGGNARPVQEMGARQLLTDAVSG